MVIPFVIMFIDNTNTLNNRNRYWTLRPVFLVMFCYVSAFILKLDCGITCLNKKDELKRRVTFDLFFTAIAFVFQYTEECIKLILDFYLQII